MPYSLLKLSLNFMRSRVIAILNIKQRPNPVCLYVSVCTPVDFPDLEAFFPFSTSPSSFGYSTLLTFSMTGTVPSHREEKNKVMNSSHLINQIMFVISKVT